MTGILILGRCFNVWFFKGLKMPSVLQEKLGLRRSEPEVCPRQLKSLSHVVGKTQQVSIKIYPDITLGDDDFRGLGFYGI